jgi:hypothetical protein
METLVANDSEHCNTSCMLPQQNAYKFVTNVKQVCNIKNPRRNTLVAKINPNNMRTTR